MVAGRIPRLWGSAEPRPMGRRPPDDSDDRGMRVGGARRSRIWRALISVIAGGGITAAGLGPLSATVFASEGLSSAGEGTTTTSTSEAPPTETTKTETTTTETTTSTTPTQTQTTPAPSATSSTPTP